MRFRISIQVSERFSAFVELAEEPNDLAAPGDGGQPFTTHNDPAWIDAKSTDDITLRFGNVFTTTMSIIRYSDGADVQNNPLIGNGATDFITAEESIWLTASHDIDSSGSKFKWDVTASKPSFFADFCKDSGHNFFGHTSFVLGSGFRIGAGIFPNGGDVTCVADDNCASAEGGAVGSVVGLGDGDIYEFSTEGPVVVHAYYGQAKDDFSWSNAGSHAGRLVGPVSSTISNDDVDTNFYGVLGQYKFSDKFYVATRYGVSPNESADISSDEELARIQVGAG